MRERRRGETASGSGTRGKLPPTDLPSCRQQGRKSLLSAINSPAQPPNRHPTRPHTPPPAPPRPARRAPAGAGAPPPRPPLPRPPPPGSAAAPPWPPGTRPLRPASLGKRPAGGRAGSSRARAGRLAAVPRLVFTPLPSRTQPRSLPTPPTHLLLPVCCRPVARRCRRRVPRRRRRRVRLAQPRARLAQLTPRVRQLCRQVARQARPLQAAVGRQRGLGSAAAVGAAAVGGVCVGDAIPLPARGGVWGGGSPDICGSAAGGGPGPAGAAGSRRARAACALAAARRMRACRQGTQPAHQKAASRAYPTASRAVGASTCRGAQQARGRTLGPGLGFESSERDRRPGGSRAPARPAGRRAATQPARPRPTPSPAPAPCAPPLCSPPARCGRRARADPPPRAARCGTQKDAAAGAVSGAGPAQPSSSQARGAGVGGARQRQARARGRHQAARLQPRASRTAAPWGRPQGAGSRPGCRAAARQTGIQ